MSRLEIEILLLGVMSASASFFIYILFMEYARVKHLRFIKSVITLREDEINDLLEEKKRQESLENSLGYKLKRLLRHAGIESHQLLFLVVVMLLCTFIAFLFALFLRHWVGFVFGFAFGSLLVFMALGAMISQRRKEFNRSLSIAISVLVKMMKNGIGFEQALAKSISVSSSKMFKRIFSGFFQEKNTIGESAAFARLGEYVHSKELLVFALAIKIGRESGGQFSNTLEKVEKTISYRKKMQEKVDVVTREGSIGSYIVVGIAIFLYFMINQNFDGKIHSYFMESEYGRFQLLGICMWVFIGMIFNKFITRIEK